MNPGDSILKLVLPLEKVECNGGTWLGGRRENVGLWVGVDRRNQAPPGAGMAPGS